MSVTGRTTKTLGKADPFRALSKVDGYFNIPIHKWRGKWEVIGYLARRIYNDKFLFVWEQYSLAKDKKGSLLLIPNTQIPLPTGVKNILLLQLVNTEKRELSKLDRRKEDELEYEIIAQLKSGSPPLKREYTLGNTQYRLHSYFGAEWPLEIGGAFPHLPHPTHSWIAVYTNPTDKEKILYVEYFPSDKITNIFEGVCVPMDKFLEVQPKNRRNPYDLFSYFSFTPKRHDKNKILYIRREFKLRYMLKNSGCLTSVAFILFVLSSFWLFLFFLKI